jgi:hypothetical protein
MQLTWDRKIARRVDKLTIQQGRVLCIISFIAARFVYRRLGLSFDEGPLTYFLQYVDPQLLKTDLWKSLYYLYDQPPGFNLFLGIVLKAFPENHALAFRLLFIGFGVLFALSLFALMVKLGVRPWVSTALTVIFSCSPGVVLYENWLFYTYPTAALLCLAAVFLHRFASSPNLWDGLAFFFILALVAYIRGLFHLYWFIFFCLLLLYFFPQQRRKVVLAFCLPLLALGALYVKNYLVFGSLSTGDIYVAYNLRKMSYYKIPEDKHRLLIEQGTLTPLSLIRPGIGGDIEIYIDIIGPLQKTGIAVLDQVWKSTGETNFHHIGFLKVLKLLSHDNMYFIRERSDVYLKYVAREYYRWYFLPASDGWWFGNVKERLSRIQMLDRLFSLLLLSQGRPSGPAYFLVVGFPLLLAFGFYVGAKAYETRDMATFITIVFLVANILYVTLVTTFFSGGDLNRYRFKVDGFYLVLLGLLISSGGTAVKAQFHKHKGYLKRGNGLSSPGPTHRMKKNLSLLALGSCR